MNSSFNVENFKNQLRTSWMGSEVIYLKQVNSTNSYLKKIPSSDLVHGTVIITDNQKKGRGQYEKRWDSLPGKDLTFTVGLRPPKPDRLTLLTLGFAASVAGVVEKYVQKPVSIKWPNDVLVDGKKISGILTECIFKGQTPDRVCIGIGLNVGSREFTNTLKAKATSMSYLTGQSLSREKLLSELLQKMETIYHKWHKLDYSLQEEINKRMINYGEWIKLSVDGNVQEKTFKFLGVNEKGELLTLNEDLDVNTFSYEQIRIIPGGKEISA